MLIRPSQDSSAATACLLTSKEHSLNSRQVTDVGAQQGLQRADLLRRLLAVWPFVLLGAALLPPASVYSCLASWAFCTSSKPNSSAFLLCFRTCRSSYAVSYFAIDCLTYSL